MLALVAPMSISATVRPGSWMPGLTRSPSSQALPSANPSTRVSAVRAEHVLRGLAGRVTLILDAGPTPGGLESTVVDLSTATPRVLRPGPIGIEELREALGEALFDARAQATADDGALPSPGMLKKHYSPIVPLYLTDDDGARRVSELRALGRTVGWIPRGEPRGSAPTTGVRCVPLPCGAKAYAARLYATLHDLESAGVDAIVVERPPVTSAWSAVLDRLSRAAAE